MLWVWVSEGKYFQPHFSVWASRRLDRWSVRVAQAVPYSPVWSAHWARAPLPDKS